MEGITIYTIGFAKKSAETFFTKLIANRVKRVIDIRLHNTSQLAGFAKKDDLRYFLRALGDIDYCHLPSLAPTEEILEAFKKNKGDWSVYERDFLNLIAARRIETLVTPELLHEGCLLCSEETPRHCHRRLVAEYLRDKWRNVEIPHIV
jgi:uncharacterized protein (DUF488 family)